jgi:hypothetical protein
MGTGALLPLLLLLLLLLLQLLQLLLLLTSPTNEKRSVGDPSASGLTFASPASGAVKSSAIGFA